ncbi:MAG: hypothetical protein ACHREM_05330 [Polyangiales bacterium]
MNTDRIYEVFTIVSGRELSVPTDATLVEVVNHARAHVRTERRMAYMRNTKTGRVEAVNVTAPIRD